MYLDEGSHDIKLFNRLYLLLSGGGMNRYTIFDGLGVSVMEVVPRSYGITATRRIQ